MKQRTDNAFVLNLINEADSLALKNSKENYSVLLDSLLKKKSNLSNEELSKMSEKDQKDFDSLKVAIQNNYFLDLFKKMVDVNFDNELIKTNFEKAGLKNFEIVKPDYNLFQFTFIDYKNYLKAKNLFNENSISFHEALESEDLEKLKNCFLKENKKLVQENYLKDGKDNYILFYDNNSIVFQELYNSSKCFDFKKVTYLENIKNKDAVYTKIYLVKKSNKIEENLSKSLNWFDVDFKQNANVYKENTFKISVYLDEIGKQNLKTFSTENIGKQIIISNKNQFILAPTISNSLNNGMFLFTGNLFDADWQDLLQIVTFQVFKNSVTIE